MIPALGQLDANLLVTLDLLLEERSVTGAARRQGVTQSAMSQALGRLRDLFDDPLLVRVGSSMEPSPRAQRLALPLRQALTMLSAAMAESPAFDPAAADRTYRIAATDYVVAVLLPHLAERVLERAPAVRLQVVPVEPLSGALDQLERGDLDMVIGVFGDTPASVDTEALFDETFVCIVRHGHPILRKKKRRLEAYVAADHALIAPRGRPGSTTDRLLAERGLERHVAVTVPYVLGAPALVAQSDLVLTVPRRIADTYRQAHGLCSFEPPLPVGRFTVRLAWHRRFSKDPSLVWLHDHVTAAAACLS